MDYERLGPARGTRAVVFGGCGGIGREYVRGLLAAGCRVAVLDRASAIAASPPQEGATAIPADASNDAEIESAFAAAEKALGGIDLMAHLIGINNIPAKIEDIDLSDLDRVMAINLRSATLCCKLALAAMKKGKGGTIVLTSSGLGANPEPTFGAYSMSKAALFALTKTVAKEGAPHVRANAVAPGVVDTAFLSGGTGGAGGRNAFQESPELKAKILASIPAGRMAVAEDVAGPMLFLSGDASRYMTGQILYINGGRMMP